MSPRPIFLHLLLCALLAQLSSDVAAQRTLPEDEFRFGEGGVGYHLAGCSCCRAFCDVQQLRDVVTQSESHHFLVEVRQGRCSTRNGQETPHQNNWPRRSLLVHVVKELHPRRCVSVVVDVSNRVGMREATTPS